MLPRSDSRVADIAVEVLTPRQLETWVLEQYGMSQRQIAIAHSVCRSTVRTNLDSAHRKLYEAGVRVNSKGQWYVEGSKAA